MRSAFALIVVIAACNGGGHDSCVPGASLACACSDGAMGAQICDDGGHLGVCSCDAHGSPSSPAPPGSPPPTSDPGGPTLLSFNASSSTLTQGQTITFSAILTTPSGTDALAGGTLGTPDGTGTYGPFDAGAQKGAFSLALSWEQVNQTLAIDFADAETRIFQAVFFDTSGRRATASVAVTLRCGGQPACSGTCVNPTDVAPKACGAQVVGAHTPASCDTVCAAGGLTCVPYCHLASGYSDPSFNPLLAGKGYYLDSGAGGVDAFFDSCADVPPASQTDPNTNVSYAFSSVDCCCH